MSEYSIEVVGPIKEGYLLDRMLNVYWKGTKLFRVLAYTGNCCGASTIVGVNSYLSDPIKGALEYLANLSYEERYDAELGWPLRSFFYYGSDNYQYKITSSGMKEVFRYPSRSEPGHDVVVYFIDFGPGKEE